jgi:hypothetical protein
MTDGSSLAGLALYLTMVKFGRVCCATSSAMCDADRLRWEAERINQPANTLHETEHCAGPIAHPITFCKHKPRPAVSPQIKRNKTRSTLTMKNQYLAADRASLLSTHQS